MQVITLDQVKTQLGITGTASDAAINIQLPFIDSIVKQITNRRFSFRFAADLTSGSTTATVYPLYDRQNYDEAGINSPYQYVDIMASLEIGMELEGDNISAGTYIQDLYKEGTEDINGVITDTVYITLSSAATATSSGDTLTAGINIAYKKVIAKGVQYLINETSTTINDTGWSSKSGAGLSVTKGTNDQVIDGKSGMPSWFVKGLPRYQR